MNIAIIPARGGSKRIRDKNIREFCGRPVIAWSIDAARDSNLFDRIMVSTDSPRIASVAQECGAEVPFTRPAELSDDTTATIPVIRHAIEHLGRDGIQPEFVCCIYAATPLIEAADLQAAFQVLQNNAKLDFAFPVTEFSFPVWRGLQIDNNRVSMVWPEHELTRSQDLPTVWHDAGQFYFGRTGAFLVNEGFFSACAAPIILPGCRVQDIDTEDDWQRAEAIFRARESVA